MKANNQSFERPFQSYFGGKSGNGTYQIIINEIPKCDVFIDAMVGGGGIVSHLSIPDLTVINDIDAGIIGSYDCMRSPTFNIESLHVLDLIDKYDNEARKTVFYFDPPYLKTSRKSQLDIYNFEWEESDHVDFLAAAVTVKSSCMISHYPCQLYDVALKDWRKITFQSNTRHGLATEALYMNYPPPVLLQDYRYIGTNFIDRQRIKRKAQRWAANFARLPLHEQQLIMSMLAKVK